MMKILFYGFVLLLVSGCSVTTPSVTEYRLDPQLNIQVKETRCSQKSIEITPLFVNNSLNNTTMRYKVGEYKEYLYTQSAWADAPSKMIANKLANVLQNSSLFKGVFSYRSPHKGDLVLELSVNEFMQSFDEKQEHSEVKLDISMNLFDKKTTELIATKSFVKVMQTETLDAQGGVDALNSVLGDTLNESVMWLEKRCQ